MIIRVEDFSGTPWYANASSTDSLQKSTSSAIDKLYARTRRTRNILQRQLPDLGMQGLHLVLRFPLGHMPTLIKTRLVDESLDEIPTDQPKQLISNINET